MPITSPSFCTGRELWALAIPYSVRPDDPGLTSKGVVSAVTKAVGGGNPGTLVKYSGAPTDTFACRVEVVAGGALGTATARGSLDSGTTWLPTTQIPADGVWELEESGLFLLFAGSQTALDAWTFTTTEAPRQALLRRAAGAKMMRYWRTRGAAPPAEYGDDLRMINARLAAYELLRPLRGQERTPPQVRQQLEGMEALYLDAMRDLEKIAEEYQQTDLPGQSNVLGVAARSLAPQAPGPGTW